MYVLSTNTLKIGIIYLTKSKVAKIISQRSPQEEGMKEMKSRSSETDSLQGDIVERRVGKKTTGRFWAMTDGPWGRLSPFLHLSLSSRAIPNRRLCYVFNKIKPQADYSTSQP